MIRDVARNRASGAGGARPLPKLRSGASGIIVRIASTEPGRLVKLSSLGIMPGVRVVLVQRTPAVVFRIAETSVAIDGEVADEILVEPDAPTTGR